MMKSVITFLALVALSQGVPSPLFLDGRIINGNDVKIGEIPYQVSLQIGNNFHFCGGSILNENYVITAAHCVKGMEGITAKVIAGSNDLENPQSTHSFVKTIVHTEYDPSHSHTNDIGLIKVYPPFNVSKTISFVPLPERRVDVPTDAIAVVSGWGTLWQGGPASRILQRTEVQIASQYYCNTVNSQAGAPVYPTQICAYSPDVTTGPCNGDSGGPLMVDGKLVGIASWVISCASRINPTVYTRVPDFVDWIEANAV